MPPENPPQNIQISNQAPKNSGVGPIVGVVIVVAIVIFGALYFWGQRLNKQESVPPLVQGGVQINN